MRKGMKVALLAALIAVIALTAAAQATNYSAWSTAQKIDEIAGNNSELNTPFQDGCPIQSPDGLRLYIATTRPRFAGDTRTDLDIWVAKRSSVGAPWGAPVNLGEPVNSTADDFCPTPVRGKGLYFVSRKTTAASCGLGDIYFTRRNSAGEWKQPRHFACAPAGPNSELDEQGPSYVEAGGSFLYFSRSSATVPGDIYVSEKRLDGSFRPATAVAELNSAGNDIQPNVRKDGLEVVLSSNRVGSLGSTQDIWVSTRGSVGDPWSEPVNLGNAVNTAAAAESRPSLSWDARTLLFGRTPGPEGIGDIFVSTRTTLGGS
jgi:WD40-like Beta Propeller Repeat